ncbi:hypothetical protein Tco_0836943 [Tanacetum coccineum]
MTKSYCPLKQSKVFPVFSTTNELFQAPHNSSIQQLLIDGFDHDAGYVDPSWSIASSSWFYYTLSVTHEAFDSEYCLHRSHLEDLKEWCTLVCGTYLHLEFLAWLGTMSSMPFNSYLAALDFVMEAVYFLSLLPPLRYSKLLLKKKLAGTI